MWEPRTRREAEEACLALNYSLIHVTPGVREMMEHALQSLNDNDNSTLQFSIEFWANHSPDNNRPEGQIQYDMFPSTHDSSDLCVKIVFEVHNTRFGWVPVDCENKTAKAGTCCNQGLLYEARYKALLVLKKTNWYTADHICKEEGGTLFDTNNWIMNLIKVSFDSSPWEEENVTDIWSAQSVNESEDPEMCSLSRVIPPQPDLSKFSSQLVLDLFDSCEKAKHMSICMIPSSQLFYSHLKNIILVDDKIFINTTSRAKNTTECMEECNGFNKVGVTCMGFNYDKKSSTCRFSEDKLAPLYRPDPSLSIDLYLILPITRMIVITVATLVASIASVVVLFSIIRRILSILNKGNFSEAPGISDTQNMFQTEQLQTCPFENEIEIPSYDDDEVLYSTNIIYSLPPIGFEGTIY
ncbi:unnamed protein product [Mytilus coruscus]|uniref:Apple domain-containing protein n=1 Tax=Mytilus coruscus TaxID=42192 RepID=A0A6J8DUZ7_MYTCO|nr:unnamed protein product [Mytilus coruscus]